MCVCVCVCIYIYIYIYLIEMNLSFQIDTSNKILAIFTYYLTLGLKANLFDCRKGKEEEKEKISNRTA